MRAMLALPLILGACAAMAPAPAPQAARLSAEVLTVTLTDGTVCRAPNAPAGRLAPCGPGFDYAVTIVARPNLLRQLAVGVFGALGGDGVLAPMAEVVLTDGAGGTWRFVSPPPVE